MQASTAADTMNGSVNTKLVATTGRMLVEAVGVSVGVSVADHDTVIVMDDDGVYDGVVDTDGAGLLVGDGAAAALATQAAATTAARSAHRHRRAQQHRVAAIPAALTCLIPPCGRQAGQARRVVVAGPSAAGMLHCLCDGRCPCRLPQFSSSYS